MQLSGGAFLSVGILLLYKRDLHDIFKLFSYESKIVPSFQNVGYVLIGVGALIFIVGLLGCCGSVRESKLLLGLYIFFIILVMTGELVVGMYAVLLGEEWENRLPSTLKHRILTYNYTQPAMFEYDLDVIHKQFMCCGIEGPKDFHANIDYQLYGKRLPSSCCSRLQNGVCVETDSYGYGCYRNINEQMTTYSHVIIAVGIAVAVLELTALILAVCVCRNTSEDDDYD
ncbi:unnamed protein product [Didymodactylos carnosus]|uniref:Tetraspanin n=1 Tax=Didymodactylos carnosus TaxID=1234261 RepID=A0A814NQ12_9BILA|nr:unnamed protein product [Didymodactylos carnosus]CAF1096226.1 unnamed protein product [Didymodactylos carnosus]CAF3689957.1 unnamed protein product [Didymodactylos carnosus]CAF3861504.1 unnamed protein product [Didymodactylos carnosus]